MTPASRPDLRDVNPAILERIQKYTPRDSSMPEREWLEVAQFAREAVLRARPTTPGIVATELITVARFARWCLGQSLPLDAERCFTPAWVDEYDRRCLKGLPSRKDYRTRLRRIAVANTRKAPWPQPPQPARRMRIQPPYSEPELALLETAAEGQRTRKGRARAWAILSLGLGCGLWPREILLVQADDVEVHDEFVVVAVRGGNPRRVPVLPRYAPVLRRLSRDAPDPRARLVQGEDRLDNIIRKFKHVSVPFRPTRMRNTWLVHLMNQGVSVPEVVALSGATTTHFLFNLIPYLDRRPDDDLFLAIGGGP